MTDAQKTSFEVTPDLAGRKRCAVVVRKRQRGISMDNLLSRI
jgi:hypothetical protein